jgi:hypothetical protein
MATTWEADIGCRLSIRRKRLQHSLGRTEIRNQLETHQLIEVVPGARLEHNSLRISFEIEVAA